MLKKNLTMRSHIRQAQRKSHQTTVIVDRVATELGNDVKVIPLPSQLYHSRFPISKAKIADLQQLVASGAIQQNYRSFYDNLNKNLNNLVENEKTVLLGSESSQLVDSVHACICDILVFSIITAFGHFRA